MLYRKMKVMLITAVLLYGLLPAAGAAASGNVLTELTAEMLTKEVSDCITKDLVLPGAVNGTAVSWQSDNRAAISDTGEVVRDRSESQTAVMTASTANGERKSFAFTVAPELTYVYYQNNFYQPQYAGKDIRDCLQDWEMNYNKSLIASSVQKEAWDGQENYFMNNDLWKDQPYYAFSGVQPDGRVTIAMKARMSSSAIEDEVYDFVLGFGESGETARLRFNFKNDALQEIRFSNPVNANAGGAALAPAERLSLLDRWVSFRWEMDLERKNMNVYIDDVLVNHNIPDCPLGITGSALNRIQFNLGLLKNGLSLGIDDMVVSSALDENTYGPKLVQKKLISEHLTTESPLAITKDLDLSLSDLSALLQDNHVSVSFTSSNSERVTVSGGIGVVTRGEKDEPVTVQARIEGLGGAVQTKSFDYIIKNKNTAVHASESFYYPDYLNRKTSEVPGCGWLPATGVKDGLAFIDRDDESYVMRVQREKSGEEQSNGYTFRTAPQKDITISCRLKFAKPLGETPLYIYRLYGNYFDGEKIIAGVQLAEIEIAYSESGTSLYVLSQYGSDLGRRQALSAAPPLNKWVDFKVEADAGRQTFYVWMDGTRLNTEPLPFYARDLETADRSFCTAITKVGIYPYKTSGGILYVDDFAAESQMGISADAVVYSEGKRIESLEMAAAGKPISADAFMYHLNAEEVQQPMAVAAIYQNGKLFSVQTKTAAAAEQMATKISFSGLALPKDRQGVQVRFYYLDNADTLRPLCQSISFSNYTTGTVLPQERTDEGTGRSYYVMDFNGENALRSYYTMPIWHPDGERFYFYNGQNKIFEYCTNNGEYRYIDTAYGENLVMVSAKGNLFYINNDREVVKMDTASHTKQTVGELPDCYTGAVMLLQVNRAETKLSVEGYSNDLDRQKCERIPLMDIATGEWTLDYSYGFELAVCAPDHMNLNPVYDNLILFAHEGSGVEDNGCGDRIWMLDTNTGSYYNIFKQKQYTDIIPGEKVSHEGWSYDGERIVIALSRSPIGMGGILTLGKDGSDRRYVNNDYSYLHLASSPATDRFIVADTAYDGKITELVLIDIYTGESHHLATLRQNGKNPGHTHPNFSMDGNKVIFGLYKDDGKTIQIGWMDISDIVNTDVTRDMYQLSDSCVTESCSGTDFEVEKTAEGIVIPSGNHMNIKVKNDVVPEAEQTDIEVTVSYVDEGCDDIVFSYEEWKSGAVNSLAERTYSIERTGSGAVKSKAFVLQNVNLEKMKRMGADFTVCGRKTDAVIRSVSVYASAPVQK